MLPARWPATKGGTTRPEIEVFDDLAELAERFSALAVDAPTIAFSRPTPREVFGRVQLASDAEVYQVDERQAPVGSEDRNATLVERDLAPPTFHPMRTAEAYERLLCERLGEPPVFDVVHLGLGPDGHTASLLPDDAVLDVTDRWVATSGPANGYERITLTYATIDVARRVVFVVTGEPKADALSRVLNGDRLMPAARIENDDVTFLVDRGAASRL